MFWPSTLKRSLVYVLRVGPDVRRLSLPGLQPHYYTVQLARGYIAFLEMLIEGYLP